MEGKLLHTPEGVRDIYSIEYKKKLALSKRLHKVLHLYGYQDIQTPAFEFFDVFRKEIGTIPSKELYKFFDREGNTLVLRPDITPQIARVAATLLSGEDIASRLCYVENTFINHSSYQGRLKENTQLGAELIGIASPEADAEMLSLVVECLKSAGLKEFQINIGNAEFFQSLIEATELGSEEEELIRELINNRNYFGVEELLNQVEIKKSSMEAFVMLPELIGGPEILTEAKKIAPNARALKAVKHLEMIYQLLKNYNAEQYITFDLSMHGIYGYYTGLIFRGYTYGTGDAIVKGGRYDKLIAKFGKDCPSIGFAIVIDELMNALNRQKIAIPYEHNNTLVLYDEDSQSEAISLAGELRAKGKQTELLKKNPEKPLEEYWHYGERNMCKSMIYLQDGGQVAMYNLVTGERKVVNRQK